METGMISGMPWTRAGKRELRGRESIAQSSSEGEVQVPQDSFPETHLNFDWYRACRDHHLCSMILCSQKTNHPAGYVVVTTTTHVPENSAVHGVHRQGIRAPASSQRSQAQMLQGDGLLDNIIVMFCFVFAHRHCATGSFVAFHAPHTCGPLRLGEPSLRRHLSRSPFVALSSHNCTSLKFGISSCGGDARNMSTPQGGLVDFEYRLQCPKP